MVSAAAIAASILLSACLPGPACWRPYSESSPFNQRLPAEPALMPGSARRVARLVDDPRRADRPDHLLARDDGRQGEPAYWAAPSDPVRRVHCTKPWGRCEVEGARVRIPARAVPEAGSDRHLTVVDRGTEYNFWGFSPPRGGTVHVRWGGSERLATGLGTSSAATASNFAGLAGRVRAEELAAGEIRHALNVTIPCTNGRTVAPVRPPGHGGFACRDGDRLPMGARLQLEISDEELRPLPRSRRALYRAMRDYGMFVGDTGSGALFSIEQQSGLRWRELARAEGWPRTEDGDGHYLFLGGDGIDWRGRLRVVHPCVTRRAC